MLSGVYAGVIFGCMLTMLLCQPQGRSYYLDFHGECVLLPHRSMGATCCSSEETEFALPRVKMLKRAEKGEV